MDMDSTKLTRTAHRVRESRLVQTRSASRRRADLATIRAARFGHDMRDVAVTEGDKVEGGTSPR